MEPISYERHIYEWVEARAQNFTEKESEKKGLGSF